MAGCASFRARRTRFLFEVAPGGTSARLMIRFEMVCWWGKQKSPQFNNRNTPWDGWLSVLGGSRHADKA